MVDTRKIRDDRATTSRARQRGERERERADRSPRSNEAEDATIRDGIPLGGSEIGAISPHVCISAYTHYTPRLASSYSRLAETEERILTNTVVKTPQPEHSDDAQARTNSRTGSDGAARARSQRRQRRNLRSANDATATSIGCSSFTLPVTGCHHRWPTELTGAAQIWLGRQGRTQQLFGRPLH